MGRWVREWTPPRDGADRHSKMGILSRIIPACAPTIPARALLSAGLSLLCAAGTVSGQVQTSPGGDPEPESQPTLERPSGANRVVRLFDFEESDFNPLPIPFGWVRAQNDPAVPRVRPGFPIWNQGELDTSGPAVSGTGSVRLPAKGGSTSIRLLPGAIGVFPGADYMVDAWVRTEHVLHARACLTARFLDERGEPIEGTRAISAKVRTNGEWERVSAILTGIDERAAYMQIELLVLQPEQQRTEFGRNARRERPYNVWREDYHGVAWFDDVAVTLLPRIEVDTGKPGQVFRADETPSVSLLVRDLTGERLSGTLRVLDADGRLVDRQSMRSSSGRLHETLTPVLPGPGWYRAILDVESGGVIVAQGELDLAWGAPEEDTTLTREASRTAYGSGSFGLSADAWTAHSARALPGMAEWAGAKRVSVGVWNEDQRKDDVRPGINPAFDAVRALIDAGIDTTIRLGESPADLADLVGRDPWDIAGALGDDEMLWMPWAERALDRFGQSVISWQIGDEPIEHNLDDLRRQTMAADDVISRWVPGPELRSSLPIGDAIEPAFVIPGRGLVLIDDGGGTDDMPAQRVREWAALYEASRSDADRARSARGEASLTIEFPSAMHGRATRAQLGRTARRAITAWVTAHEYGVAERVTVSLRTPWRATAGRRPEMMPAPELAVWRTLSGILDGAGAARSIDLLPGVRTIVVDGNPSDGPGVLIAWLDDPDAPSHAIELPLGTGAVTRVGLMGARTPIPLTAGHRDDISIHRVGLGREPVLITGVDVAYIELLASIRLTPGVLEPRLGQRTHELTIDNPFGVPVQGKAFIVEPGGFSGGLNGRDRTWILDPRVLPFEIAGDASVRLPVSLSFGASQQSGWLAALIDVEFADPDKPPARVTRWLKLTSDALRLEISAIRLGSDLIVHAFVTNTGVEPSTVDLTAFVPGSPRERSLVPGVLPNATAHRRYVFRDVPPDVMASVSLGEESTGTRLLKKLDVP